MSPHGIIRYVVNEALAAAELLRKSAADRRRIADEEDEQAATLEEMHAVASRHAPATTIGLVNDEKVA